MSQARRTQLLRVHSLWVILLAQKAFKPGMELKDLIAEGNIGLLKAMKTWNKKKSKLITYSTPFIKRAINKYVQQYQYVVNRPQNTYSILKKNTSKKAVENINTASMIYSLDAAAQLQAEQDLEEDIGQQLQTEKALVIISTLPERDRYIITNSFGLMCKPMTRKKMGRELKVSPERIRQLLNTALKKVRSVYEQQKTI